MVINGNQTALGEDARVERLKAHERVHVGHEQEVDAALVGLGLCPPLSRVQPEQRVHVQLIPFALQLRSRCNAAKPLLRSWVRCTCAVVSPVSPVAGLSRG